MRQSYSGIGYSILNNQQRKLSINLSELMWLDRYFFKIILLIS
jgi:hypothetical protein